MKNRLRRSFLIASFVLANFLSLQIFAQDLNTDETMGSEPFRTWVRTNDQGRPVAIGLTASVRALTDFENTASSTNPMPEMSIPFPRHRNLPFTHLYFSWNPHGHEPPGIYDLPHYDVHFYILPEAQRMSITCSGADEARCMKQPNANALPANYGKTPAGVPKMGWHWLDLLSPELHGHPFTSTLVYGYYDGHVAFLEPMVTKAFMESHPDYTAPIRQPAVYPRGGYYPTDYRVRYLPVTDAYEFSLRHFVYRR